jgi:hypothetical protein
MVTAAPLLATSNDGQPGAFPPTSGPSPARAGDEGDGGRPRGRFGLRLGLVVALVAAVATWLLTRGDDTEPLPAEPPAVTTSTAAIEADPTKAAGEAYIAFEEAVAAAGAIPDPDFPPLRETATGQALADAVEQLRAWQLSGRVARAVGPVTDGVRVTGASQTTEGVRVRACEVNDDQVVVADTGQVVNADVVTRLYDVTVVQEADRWKVSQLRVIERWEGVAGCAGDRA